MFLIMPLPEDARVADSFAGTVFYLFSPFTGSILADVLTVCERKVQIDKSESVPLDPAPGYWKTRHG